MRHDCAKAHRRIPLSLPPPIYRPPKHGSSMADRQNSDRAGRTSSGAPAAAGNACGGTTRITDASCLTLQQHLDVLDEATELPPFGLNIAGLEQRLKRRLGLEISQVRQLASLPLMLRKTFCVFALSPSLLTSTAPFFKIWTNLEAARGVVVMGPRSNASGNILLLYVDLNAALSSYVHRARVTQDGLGRSGHTCQLLFDQNHGLLCFVSVRYTTWRSEKIHPSKLSTGHQSDQ